MKLLWVLVSVVAFVCGQVGFAASTMENGIVALVNDQVITQYDLRQQVNFFTNQLKNEGKGSQLPPEVVIRQQVLQQMIDTAVQTWVAQQSSITISNAEVNQAIANVAKQSALTEKQLYDKMQSFGLSVEAYRNQVKDQLLIHTLVQRDVVPTISVTDEQVALFQQSLNRQKNGNAEYLLADLLIETPDAATSADVQAAKKTASDLLQRIRSGELNFAKAAEAYSDGQNALQGGRMAWRKFRELPTAFADVVGEMGPGDVVGPIRAPNGYHLLKLLEVKHDAGAKPPTEAEVRQALFQKKLAAAQQGWLARLKAQSYIKVVNRP